VFGLGFFRSKTSDTGNFSRVQNEVKLIFEKFSVFLMGVITTTERRGRHEIEQSQIGPKGEGVGTSESKKRRTRTQKRDLAQRRRDAEGEEYKDRLPWFLFAGIRGPVFFTAGMAVCPFFVFLSASAARRESLGGTQTLFEGQGRRGRRRSRGRGNRKDFLPANERDGRE
jgi:hypothetical protein